MTRATVYARLSRDRDGTQTATARQVADCRKFAEAKGWEVIATHEDADLSAYSAKVTRPGFEAVLASVEAGEADVVLAWKLDRLLRRPRDFEKLWQLCEATGANVATVTDGIDTSQPMAGLLMPRIMATFAELEAENLSIREKRKHEETAKAGKRSGGGSRPFGLTRDWSAIVPDEAELLRDAVDRILGGQSMYRIATDWNGRGIKTPTGRAWSVQLLKSMLRSPRLAGLREHRGAIVAAGQWPAIVDPDKHERLRAHLSRKGTQRQAGRFLLSGLVRCGVCGQSMYVRRRHKDKARFYGCEKAAGGAGCGHVHIVAEPLEAMVRDAVLERLNSPEMLAAIEAHNRQTVEAADLDTLRADEDALEQLARDHYTDRIIGRSEYLAARDGLVERIEAARRKVARVNGSGRLGELAGFGEELRAAWDGESLDWQRQVVQTIVDKANVTPGRRGPNRFDPSRVTVDWRY
ncbi:MAG TPA: recombinase family protein [Candidatus Limnocylindrales bacterium]|nr:recombinase family protein [Candidatus Limnocylindrales bacterium]